MLIFVLLIVIAVSIVHLDGASNRSPQEYKELTRRMKIFESITKSEDQQHDDSSMSIDDEQGISTSDDNQTVNDILQHSLVELTEILRALDSGDASKAMRIPLHVIPVQSSMMVFQSLLRMLSNPKESLSSEPWQNYLIGSIKNQQCSVMDLCREFEHNFKCDEEGHLTAIGLDLLHF